VLRAVLVLQVVQDQREQQEVLDLQELLDQLVNKALVDRPDQRVQLERQADPGRAECLDLQVLLV